MRSPLSGASSTDPPEGSSASPDEVAGGGATGGAALAGKRKGPDVRLLQVINPLNALVGFASMLADVGHELSAEQRHRYAVRVREAAETLERVMASLMHSLDGKDIELGEGFVSSGTFRVSPVATPPREEARGAFPESLEADRAIVFVVDGDEANRELIGEYLDGYGYELKLLGSVEEARETAEQYPPDLILIDPFVEGELGFAGIKVLRGCNPSGPVPVLLVTALADDESRILARDAGVEQILAKPMNHHELRASVKNQLHLRAQQEELSVQSAQVKSLQRFKSETTGMLVHDFKSPLSAMMMNLDFALADMPNDEERDDLRSALSESRIAGAKLCRMVANLLDVARSDDGRLLARKGKVDVEALFILVASEHAVEAHARKVAIKRRVLLSGPIDADPDLIGRVVAKLFEKVLRYTFAGGYVALTARPTERGIEILVENDGKPISPEWSPLVFDEYVRATAPLGMNRGMGLYFCQVAVEAHGGQIAFGAPQAGAPGSAATGAEPMSTCFKVTLPNA